MMMIVRFAFAVFDGTMISIYLREAFHLILSFRHYYSERLNQFVVDSIEKHCAMMMMHSFVIFVEKFYKGLMVMVVEVPSIQLRMLFVDFLSSVSMMLMMMMTYSKNSAMYSYLMFVVERILNSDGIESE
jgi:hypothetical protein